MLGMLVDLSVILRIMRQLLSVFLTHLKVLETLFLQLDLVAMHGLVDDSLSIRVLDVVRELGSMGFEEDGVFTRTRF